MTSGEESQYNRDDFWRGTAALISSRRLDRSRSRLAIAEDSSALYLREKSAEWAALTVSPTADAAQEAAAIPRWNHPRDEGAPLSCAEPEYLMLRHESGQDRGLNMVGKESSPNHCSSSPKKERTSEDLSASYLHETSAEWPALTVSPTADAAQEAAAIPRGSHPRDEGARLSCAEPEHLMLCHENVQDRSLNMVKKESSSNDISSSPKKERRMAGARSQTKRKGLKLSVEQAASVTACSVAIKPARGQRKQSREIELPSRLARHHPPRG